MAAFRAASLPNLRLGAAAATSDLSSCTLQQLPRCSVRHPVSEKASLLRLWHSGLLIPVQDPIPQEVKKGVQRPASFLCYLEPSGLVETEEQTLPPDSLFRQRDSLCRARLEISWLHVTLLRCTSKVSQSLAGFTLAGPWTGMSEDRRGRALGRRHGSLSCLFSASLSVSVYI